eukprot:jgi/Ulvmu1/9899/UM057_0056.1
MPSRQPNAPADASKHNATSMLHFSLDDAKSEVIKELQAILPASVKRFMKETGYDSLVTHCLLYFIATFQRDLLQKGLEKAHRQHMDSYDPVAAVSKLASLEQEARRLKAEISPLYAMIIMRYSSYQHVNRDRLFFEGLYITIINICDDAFHALGNRSEIELFLGQLFRGRHFNLYDALQCPTQSICARARLGLESLSILFLACIQIHAQHILPDQSCRYRRINAPARSIDTLSLKEVYAIKHETANRALNSKLLSSLNARPQSLNISAAAVNNSPLISNFISSVITARALIKDPEFRKTKMQDAANMSTSKARAPGVQPKPSKTAARPARLCVGVDSASTDVSTTPTAYPPASQQGKLPSNGLQTATTSGSLDMVNASSCHHASTVTDHPAGDLGSKQFVGPGFENLGFLYDDTMGDLEDLREYCISGRHPKLELRKSSRRTMTRAESSLSTRRSSPSGSVVED